MKEILKIKFVALKILNQAQRENLHISRSWEMNQGLINAIFVLLYVKVHQKAGGKRMTLGVVL